MGIQIAGTWAGEEYPFKGWRSAGSLPPALMYVVSRPGLLLVAVWGLASSRWEGEQATDLAPIRINGRTGISLNARAAGIPYLDVRLVPATLDAWLAFPIQPRLGTSQRVPTDVRT